MKILNKEQHIVCGNNEMKIITWNKDKINVVRGI